MITMDGVDPTIFYDDDSNFMEHGYNSDNEYDYEYEDLERETLVELYQYCLIPTIYDTALYMMPLVAAVFSCRLLAQIKFLPCKWFHGLSTIIGMSIIQHYAPECFYLLLTFTIISYAALHMPRKYRKGVGIFLPSLLIILYCEFTMQPIIWHKVRSLIMTMAMKIISIAADTAESNDLPDFYSYTGYMFCAATCFFGPWIPFKDYVALRQKTHQERFWILGVLGYAFVSFGFLSISNCWTQWICSDNSWKWFVAYRDALSFRSSHYFISYSASTLLLLRGHSFLSSSIVKPLEIEFPRSLVQVVIYWNIPMHFWLKTYVFRPSLKYWGKFGGVTITYLASALLHGLNFQLGAVLFSLGLYTYIEYQLRMILANVFDACIASKQCIKNKCTHSYNPHNCWWVIVTNMIFSILSIFHLAYLGLMFDMSDLQETGYSYIHTVKKWSELGFASHWVAFATYCIYFLI